jgi:hypothetical protein
MNDGFGTIEPGYRMTKEEEREVRELRCTAMERGLPADEYTDEACLEAIRGFMASMEWRPGGGFRIPGLGAVDTP